MNSSRGRACVAIAAALACPAFAHADEPFFMVMPTDPMPLGPFAVSADARFLVGYGLSDRPGFAWDAWRWSEKTGVELLGHLPGSFQSTRAVAVSGRGGVVVGPSNIRRGITRAYRWTEWGGMENLGSIHDVPDDASRGRAVSANGRVVAGRSGTSNTGELAVRWTRETGMQWLGAPPDAIFETGSASGISLDGRVIVGRADGSGVFRWTEEDGMVSLGALPGAASNSGRGYAANADGSVVVGQASSANGNEAFRWTEDGGMVGLGDLWKDAPSMQSIAFAVSADGGVVVGRGRGNPADGLDTAFIWTKEDGMRRLSEVLVQDYGLDLQGMRLGTATGISADGRTIVGSGGIPGSPGPIGWIAYLGRACRADFNKDGVVDSQDVVDYLAAWMDGSIFADWDYNGVVDSDDLFLFLTDWSNGC